jgi:hypothetical protein
MLGDPGQSNQFFVDSMNGTTDYSNQYQWPANNDAAQFVEQEKTRKIRTPRVHFPIGSRFDYEQNQQALRDRLAQLTYEMDNLHYLSQEEAELKRLEKELVEDQIEQFRQVWELQTYLAGGADAPLKCSDHGRMVGPDTATAAGIGTSGQARASKQQAESHMRPVGDEEPVREDIPPTIARSTTSSFKPVERETHANKVAVKHASDFQRKSDTEYSMQTSPSMVPIRGKENRGSASASQESTVTLPIITERGQISFRHTVGAGLGSRLLRQNVMYSEETPHVVTAVDVESSNVGEASQMPTESSEPSVEADQRIDDDQTSSVPKTTRRELQRSVEELRLSAGMPTNAVESSRIPVKKSAFAQQLRKIAAISRALFGDRPSTTQKAEEADKPGHKASSNREGEVIEARDGAAFAVMAPLLPQVDGVSATVGATGMFRIEGQARARCVAMIRNLSTISIIFGRR